MPHVPHADVFAANRAAWNEKTPHHVASEFYDVEAFVAGKCSLTEIELARVGDVHGKSMLHLQCHFGLDTISWARRGARATGLDFSDAAIREARRLAERVGADARFVCGNVYDAPSIAGTGFDVVFTSWGVLGWLPDLAPWARAVESCLAPGGELHLAEFHPFRWMWDDTFDSIVYAYDGRGDAIVEEEDGTYADRAAPIRTRVFGFNHGLATVVQSLLDAGLRLDGIAEYDYSPYDVFHDMAAEEVDGRARYRVKRFASRPPLTYALTAKKRRTVTA